MEGFNTFLDAQRSQLAKEEAERQTRLKAHQDGIELARQQADVEEARNAPLPSSCLSGSPMHSIKDNPVVITQIDLVTDSEQTVKGISAKATSPGS